MNDTPRTDQAVGNWNHEYHEVVQAFFARTLERELNEAKKLLATRVEANRLSDANTEIIQLRELLSTQSEMQGNQAKIIQELRAERDQLKAEVAESNSKVQHLLNHCKDGECSVCAEIVCKYHEFLHFHHDGCPVCENPPTAEQIGKSWLTNSSLEKWFPVTAEELAQLRADVERLKQELFESREAQLRGQNGWLRAEKERDNWRAVAEQAISLLGANHTGSCSIQDPEEPRCDCGYQQHYELAIADYEKLKQDQK